MMNVFRLVQLIFPVITLGLTSCASTSDTPPPLPQFQRISIITAGDTKKDLQADSTAYLTTTRVGGGAAMGAATGTAIGLACGPFAPVCLPVTIVVGATAGAAIGQGLGETDKGLRKEQNRQANKALENLSLNLDPNEMLRQSLSAVLAESVVSVESESEAMIQVRVKSLGLVQYEKEMLSLSISAEMKTFWDFGNEKPSIQTNQYQFETGHEAAKNWLANEGERFSRGITECVDRVVGFMARDLGQEGHSQPD